MRSRQAASTVAIAILATAAAGTATVYTTESTTTTHSDSHQTMIQNENITTDVISTHSIISPAIWDGTCFYPTPDSTDFNLTAYLGRWYQVAGTFASFTAGCSCIFAEYSFNEDDDSSGAVNVFNACQRGQSPSNITGTATPAPKRYGESGVFTVKFPFGSSSSNACPGPNYIVQEFSYDNQWAIVQASNFSTLFLLSRQQNPPEASIEAWLTRAERRGSNLDRVIRVNQTGCLYTT